MPLAPSLKSIGPVSVEALAGPYVINDTWDPKDHKDQSQMPKKTLPNPAATRAAVQALLRDGLATYAEIAALSGYSRQTIRWFAGEINAMDARDAHLTKIWADALRQNE